MHSIDYRVYYEDTDAQGVVYYANYLKFCERARTEYLRLLGYEQKELMDIGVIFIVRKVIIEYLKPVNLDELIKIETRLNKVKKVLNKDMKSKCGWSPFHGEKLMGWPIGTIVNGKKVFWNNKIVKNVYGKPIEFN